MHGKASLIASEIERKMDLEKVRTLGILVDVDVRGVSMLCRGKDPNPHEYLGRFRSLEVRFRASLDRHSFALEAFHPWRWVPFTAYENWKGEWDRLQAEWAEVKQDLLDDCASLRHTFRHFPTREQIEQDLRVDYRSALILGIEADLPTGNPLLKAMHQAEMEKARQQLAETVSPWDELFQRLRARMYRDAVSVLASIQKNGHLTGRVAQKARNMVETFQMLNAHGDAELEQKLLELKAALAARAPDDGGLDVGRIRGTLQELKAATAEAAAEVRRREV